MNSRAISGVAAMLFVSALAAVRAQSGQPATQASAPTSGSASSDSANTPSKKKVWTNEDLNNPHNSSAAGRASARRPPARQGTTTVAPPKGRPAKWYHDQIDRLQTQAAMLDPKIAALQAAINGKQVDEPRKYGWLQPGNWPDQLVELQAKRNGLLEQISTLEDQARHDGVAAKDLP